MTAVNFPSSPSNGDTLISGNTTYTYNSTKTRWDAVTTVSGIQLNSLSVGAEAAASGDGGIAYDNTSGEFTYTPPVSAGVETKTYAYEGALEVHTGVKRLYSARTYTLSSVDAHLATAASGASVTINIKKNNVVVATLSLGAGSTSSLSNAFSVGLTQGDYLTIDIAQIGSTTAGTDLYLTLTLTQ